MKKNENRRDNIPKEPNDWEKIKHLPRAVHVLVIGSFVNRLGTFVLPYMALYLIHEGYTLGQASYALAAFGVGNIVATVIGGHLADTLGRRKTIALSMVGCAFMVTCLSLSSHSLPQFVCFAFATAVFSEIYRPASHALIADLVEEKDRVLVYAILRWAINAGFAFGPALAGIIAQVSYLWVFWLDGFTSLTYGLLAIFFLPKMELQKPQPLSHVFHAFGSLKESYNVCFRDLRFIQVFLSSFLIAFAFLQSFSTLGIEIKLRGFSEVHYGFILGVNGLLIVFLELPLSMFVRKFSARIVMGIGYLLIGLGFGAFAFGDGLFELYAGMVVMTFGEMIAMPVSLAYVSSMAPEDMRGRYMGMWGFSWALAMAFATSGGLKLYEGMGSDFWLLVCFLAVVGSVLILLNPNRNASSSLPSEGS